MPALKRKTKTPVLVERIDQFVAGVREAMKSSDALRNKKIRDLWDAEVRYHFDNGRTEKTLELYIMKYRYALKAEFGPKSTPLAICNMKKLRERLNTYIERADYPKTGWRHRLSKKSNGRNSTPPAASQPFFCALPISFRR